MKNTGIKAKKDIAHISFEVALLIKGVNGALEIVSGFALLFLSPDRLDRLVCYITQNELAQDPNDIVSNFLVSLSNEFSISTQYFGVFYLISHGLIKCILIYLLMKKKLWAYPLTIGALILFIAYQLYRFTISFSPFFIYLTVFDTVMIVLVYLEYQKVKAMFAAQED